MQCQPGSWLAQRYKLVEKLFQQGPLEYWQAQWQDPAGYGGEATLQIPLPIYLQHPTRQQQWRSISSHIQPLQHPNIIRLYEVGEDQGTPFVASEPFQGLNLYQIILQHNANNQTIPWDIAVQIVVEVCKGLDFAHSCSTGTSNGIFHGDLRPENILLTTQGEIKIQHFGHLHLWGDLQDAWPSEVRRRYAYAAPERWEQQAPFSALSDLFSIGVLLYELLSGKLPFNGTSIEALKKNMLAPFPPSLHNLNPSLNHTLINVVQQLIQTQPGKRLPKARDIQFLLENVLLEANVTPEPQTLQQLINQQLSPQTSFDSGQPSQPFSSNDGMFAPISTSLSLEDQDDEEEYDAGEATVIQFNPLELQPDQQDAPSFDLLSPMSSGPSEANINSFFPDSSPASRETRGSLSSDVLFSGLDLESEPLSMDDISADLESIDSIIELDDLDHSIMELEPEPDSVSLDSPYEMEEDAGEATFLQAAPLPTWNDPHLAAEELLLPQENASPSYPVATVGANVPRSPYPTAGQFSPNTGSPRRGPAVATTLGPSQDNMHAASFAPRRVHSIDDLSAPPRSQAQQPSAQSGFEFVEAPAPNAPPPVSVRTPMELGFLSKNDKKNKSKQSGKEEKEGRGFLFWLAFILLLGGGSGAGTWFYLQTLSTKTDPPSPSTGQVKQRKTTTPPRRIAARIPATRSTPDAGTGSNTTQIQQPQPIAPGPMPLPLPIPRREVDRRPPPRRIIRRRRRRNRRPTPRRTRRVPQVRKQPRARIAAPSGITGVSITVQPQCTLFIGNDVKGSSSPALKLALTPGSYLFRCVNRQKRLLHTFRVRVNAGQTTTYTKTLQTGTLRLTSKPWASIAAKGLGIIGKTGTSISLYQGRYRLTLYKKGSQIPGPGMRKHATVTIRPGSTTTPATIQFPVLDDEP